MREVSEEIVPGRRAGLRWQSQVVLLAFLPVTATWAVLDAGRQWQAHNSAAYVAAFVSVTFAALVWRMRAATPGGALTGGIVTAALFLETPGWHTALWPLLMLVVLTYAATRAGRRRKEALGTAEDSRGRRASQVAANLGMAAVAGIPWLGFGAAAGRVALVTLLAAMAEAAADTVSSELGQILGGEPRLVTTLRRVSRGTDGAISLVGTLAGCAGAATVVAVGEVALTLTRGQALAALGAAIAGLFFDSLLGATAERQGWLNNDAVNALSTVFAAALALLAWRWM